MVFSTQSDSQSGKETRKELSVVVPAYNERENLEDTITHLETVITELGIDSEILIVNDASDDGTALLAEEICLNSKRVVAIHHERNLGFGGAYQTGLAAAKGEFTMMVPADDAYPVDSLRALMRKFGKAPVICSYTQNQSDRSFFRGFLSKTFVALLNGVFSLRLKYFNGVSIAPTRLLREIPRCDNFAFSAQNLIYLIKKYQMPVTEVGVRITERENGTSKALRLRNMLSMAETLFTLVVLFRLLRFSTSATKSPSEVNVAKRP